MIKIGSRNNIKVSCMLNIKSGNNSHNTIIYHWNVNNKIRTCNYTDKAESPLQLKYLSEHTSYQGDISLENFQKKSYYGISETKYMNRIQSCKQKQHKTDTKLSKKLWKINIPNKEPVIACKISW